MTLIEALREEGIGRIRDTGCDYELVTVPRGVYKIEYRHYSGIEACATIDVDCDTPRENALRLKKAWEYEIRARKGGSPIVAPHDSIIDLKYKRFKNRKV